MEERILDDEEGRGIKLKRTADGETDAVEEGSPDDDGEYFVEMPEEYDEDLVGLTPSQLREELEKREKALREAKETSAKQTALAAEKLAAGDCEGAEPLFAEALFLDAENDEARYGLWTARTKDFSDDEAFYRAGVAEELAADEKARAIVTENAGARLREAQKAYAAEEAELRPAVEGKRAERRAAFAANRKYYAIRFGICVVVAVLFAIGIAVSADNILRTTTIVPVVLTAVFGALTLVSLGVVAVFARKFYLAQRLCRENEKPSSTESGARLEWLQSRLHALSLILQNGAPDEAAGR